MMQNFVDNVTFYGKNDVQFTFKNVTQTKVKINISNPVIKIK